MKSLKIGVGWLQIEHHNYFTLFLLIEVKVGIFRELIQDEPIADVGPVQDKLEAFPDVSIVLVGNL